MTARRVLGFLDRIHFCIGSGNHIIGRLVGFNRSPANAGRNGVPARRDARQQVVELLAGRKQLFGCQAGANYGEFIATQAATSPPMAA